MERFLDLTNRNEVVEKVLEEWLLRELRDDLVSRLTWKYPESSDAHRLRVRGDYTKPLDVYYLSPVGIGGKFFYDRPVGEQLYSAECHVVVEHEEDQVRTRLGEGRFYWVGSGDPRGYRISEGFEDLWTQIVASLGRTRGARSGGAMKRSSPS